MEKYLRRVITFDEKLHFSYKITSERDGENSEKLQSFIKNTPRPFDRNTSEGHVTATAFIIDESRSFALMIFHRKLNMWLPPGGHCDENSNVFSTAFREATEETGIQTLNAYSHEIYDIDIHTIPENKKEPEHLHYDVRLLFTADTNAPLKLNEDETSGVEWILIDELEKYNQLPSVLILKNKLEVI